MSFLLRLKIKGCQCYMICYSQCVIIYVTPKKVYFIILSYAFLCVFLSFIFACLVIFFFAFFIVLLSSADCFQSVFQ